ncbi:MAG TPA: hypothetical protein VF598_09215 [Hymenobacter sp.]
MFRYSLPAGPGSPSCLSGFILGLLPHGLGTSPACQRSLLLSGQMHLEC